MKILFDNKIHLLSETHKGEVIEELSVKFHPRVSFFDKDKDQIYRKNLAGYSYN